MTFVCSDHIAEEIVWRTLTQYGLTEGYELLKTGPTENDPNVYLSIPGEVPVVLREVLHAELGTRRGITIQEGI
jgi:hypothetical protein